MPINLKIISYHRLTPGQQEVFQPESDSFTIGRSDENDWAIPDPQRFLSGVHCRIHCEGGHYYITDTSTNGVYLNGSPKRLERDDTVALNHGDKIRIGDYEFEASIEEDSFFSDAPLSGSTETTVESDTVDDPFDDPFDDPPTNPEPQSSPQAGEDDFQKDINTPLAQLDDSAIGNAISIESLMDLDDLDEGQDDQPSAQSLREKHSPLNEAFTPASHQTDDSIPDNWDEATGMLKVPAKESEPEPVERARPEPQLAVKPAAPRPVMPGGDTLAAFARGAGLEPGVFDGMDEAALFEQVGKMMLEFTAGLIQTLSGRTHIKSEFRLDQTMIRPVENNPFKFSTSKSSTLQQLLSKRDPAYMAGIEAIREGFDDVNAHQMAVVAGMEAALQDILKRFNPKVLETRLDSDSILNNILPGGKKAKYWEIFKVLFDEIAGEAEDDFQQLFGRKFSRAYEKQLSRLKNTREE